AAVVRAVADIDGEAVLLQPLLEGLDEQSIVPEKQHAHGPPCYRERVLTFRQGAYHVSVLRDDQAARRCAWTGSAWAEEPAPARPAHEDRERTGRCPRRARAWCPHPQAAPGQGTRGGTSDTHARGPPVREAP